MFEYFYQVVLVVFLLQGISIPFLIVISGLVWSKQSREMDALKKELEIARGHDGRSSKALAEILEGLPKLQPLKCAHCGAALLLQETQTLCPHCQTRGDLPEDNAAVVSLKLQVKNLLKRAIRYWRVARVLTLRPVGWIFFLMIFAEPFVLFPTVLIGSNLYKTWFDEAFERLGETPGFIIMWSAFIGFFIWMFLFIYLASMTRGLRSKLPVVPVFEGMKRSHEAANCEACGGAIEYDSRDFACICTYCNVENFRVRFARRERTKSETQRTKTKSVLFGAMEILDDFVGTVFSGLLILFGGFVLMAVWDLLFS